MAWVYCRVTFKKQELSLALDRIQECNVNFWTLHFERDMEKSERPKERVNCEGGEM